MATKKRNKKYNPIKTLIAYQKTEDKITTNELIGGSHSALLKEARDALITNNITNDYIANHILALHRFTFYVGLEYINIRKICDDILLEFYKCWNNCEYNMHNTFVISNTNRKLLFEFINEVEKTLSLLTSRFTYAILFKAMINNHLKHIKLRPYIEGLIHKDDIKELLFYCDSRINLKSIQKNYFKSKQTKI